MIGVGAIENAPTPFVRRVGLSAAIGLLVLLCCMPVQGYEGIAGDDDYDEEAHFPPLHITGQFLGLVPVTRADLPEEWHAGETEVLRAQVSSCLSHASDPRFGNKQVSNIELYRQARFISLYLGDAQSALQALLGYIEDESWYSNYDQYQTCIERALEEAQQLGNPELLARANYQAGDFYDSQVFMAREACNYYAASAQYYSELKDNEQCENAYARLFWLYLCQAGWQDEAQRLCAERVTQIMSMPADAWTSDEVSTAALWSWQCGDLWHALTLYETAIRLDNDTNSVAELRTNVGYLYWNLGQRGQALQELESAVGAKGGTLLCDIAPLAAARLIKLCFSFGQADRGHAYIESYLAIMQNRTHSAAEFAPQEWDLNDEGACSEALIKLALEQGWIELAQRLLAAHLAEMAPYHAGTAVQLDIHVFAFSSAIELYLETGELLKAQELIEYEAAQFKAHRFAANPQDILRHRAALALAKGNLSSAASLQERAVVEERRCSLLKYDPQLLYTLAEIQQRQSQSRRAARTLEEAFKASCEVAGMCSYSATTLDALQELQYSGQQLLHIGHASDPPIPIDLEEIRARIEAARRVEQMLAQAQPAMESNLGQKLGSYRCMQWQRQSIEDHYFRYPDAEVSHVAFLHDSLDAWPTLVKQYVAEHTAIQTEMRNRLESLRLEAANLLADLAHADPRFNDLILLCDVNY